jgi:hypothetical protein
MFYVAGCTDDVLREHHASWGPWRREDGDHRQHSKDIPDHAQYH